MCDFRTAKPKKNPIGPRQLSWPILAILPFGGAMAPEGWKPLFSRGFCKFIPVVFWIANTSLVVKMAESLLRKLFSGHFGQTPLVPALMV